MNWCILKRDLPLLLLLLLAFGLRVWGLADHNIVWDEGVGIWLARQPVPRILDWTAHDVHPPLHYLVLRGWWLLVGDGEFVLRFPSALVGTLGVVFVYGLGRALGGRRAGFFAALFFALSRFAVAWSQQVRMYIWATTLGTGALWAAVRLWQRGGWRSWLFYVLATAGSLWTLFLAALVPLAANLAFPLVWLQRGRSGRSLLRWAAAQLAAAVVVVPWVVYALPRMPTWSSAEPVAPSIFMRLYPVLMAVGSSVNLERYALPTAAVFGVLVVGLAFLWRARRSPEQTAGLTMLLAGLVLPVLAVLLFTLPLGLSFGRLLAPRYFLPLSACFYVLLGWGVAELARRDRRAAVAGGGLAAAVALVGLVSYYPGLVRRDDYVSLAAVLQAHRHAGDVVVLHTDRDWPVFAAHYDGDWRGVPHGAPMDPTRAGWLLGPLWEEAEGVWLVTTPDALRADPQQALQGWLESRAAAWGVWVEGENTLALYARTPERAETFYDLLSVPVLPKGPRVELPPGAALLDAWVPLPRYPTGDTVHLFLYWDRPPQEEVVVEVEGASRRTVNVGAPPPAQNGPTFQLVDLLLTPDLSPGPYRLSVHLEDEPVEAGRFTLVGRALVAAMVSPAEIAYPLDLRLGGSIRLLGYDLSQTVVEPGGVVELTLYWQAAAVVDDRYKVFTHLLGETWNADGGNFIWGQQDNEPLNGQAQTTTWVPGAVVADPYRIPVAPDAPPGLYTLRAGMYGLVDGIRLPVSGPDGEPQGDEVVLAQIEVQVP